MTREIKFRAWDKKGRFFIGNDMLFVFADCALYNPSQRTMELKNGLQNPYPSDVKNELEMDLIFLQYTGFKDKNGKEIYEGDIVRSNCYSAEMSKHFQVLFEKDGYFVSSKNMKQSKKLYKIEEKYRITEWIKHLRKYEIEIVGNKFKDPELLEVEND